MFEIGSMTNYSFCVSVSLYNSMYDSDGPPHERLYIKLYFIYVYMFIYIGVYISIYICTCVLHISQYNYYFLGSSSNLTIIEQDYISMTSYTMKRIIT